MPEPQPGWAQQYDLGMHPAWARKFEPPAITGGESQSVIRSLIRIAQFTGEQRFLETLPAAIAYFRRSALPNGKLARFYELKSNRPLYFDSDYQLTYDASDKPTHYSFEIDSGLNSIQQELEAVTSAPQLKQKNSRQPPRPVQLTNELRRSAERVVSQLDQRHAWVELDNMRHTTSKTEVIDMRTFARNLVLLAQYVGSKTLTD